MCTTIIHVFCNVYYNHRAYTFVETVRHAIHTHLHTFHLLQVVHDAAIAIKNMIEPMFDNAIMIAATSCTAAGSDSDKDWIPTARQVHRRSDHHSMVSAQSNHDTNAPICA